ncbi:DUF6531 domain-containing protein [Bdellovibrio sp.]|uniref:DUF6531 domain-containing protein n=1 Tax=Bdellovibrio sp. TaxID=28201 RepID=UPI0039E5E62E
MIKIVPALLASMIVPPALAVVDTSSGSFIHSWVDYEGKGLDLNIKLERTYNSRSNSKGWFGFGWCSDLETAITVSENSIAVNHCGSGEEVVFQKTGTVFKSPKTHDGIFKRSGSSYVRTFADGTTEMYSSSGKLSEIRKHDDYIALKYNEQGMIKSLQDSGGRIVTTETDQNGFITSITAHLPQKGGQKQKEKIAEYTYKDANLVSATNSWGNTYTYSYDKEHNLTKAVWPGNNFAEIEYNSNDWVKSLKGTNICTEDYAYKVDGAKKPPRYTVDVKKNCDHGVVFERRYSYSYAHDHRRIVAADVDVDGVRREFKYDNDGNVVEVTEYRPNKTGIAKIVTQISRNERGHIIKISNPFESKTYKYKTGSSRDVVTEVSLETIALGKTIDSIKYTFGYDDEDRIVSLAKPDGQRLDFKYDQDRIIKISSKDMTIDVVYDPDSTEPNAIKFAGKILSLAIYDKSTIPQELSAVELYFDFVRAQGLTVPSY